MEGINKYLYKNVFLSRRVIKLGYIQRYEMDATLHLTVKHHGRYFCAELN